MKRQTVCGVVLALFIASFSTLEFGVQPVQASAGTVLQLDPTTSIANFGESFTVNIDIQDVTDLFSYDVRLTFDPLVLVATTVEEGPFLKDGTISPSGTNFTGGIANPFGFVLVTCNIVGEYPGVDGTGTLFSVTFACGTNVGLSELIFADTGLLDATSTGIPHSAKDGFFSTAHTCIRNEPASIEDPTLSLGKTFTVDVLVADVLFLYSWQVNISFNPSVLRIVDTIEGNFLTDQPEGTIGVGRIENEKGWGLFGWSTMGAYPGVSGGGTLATVQFQVVGIGESQIQIETEPFELLGDWLYPTMLLAQVSLFPPPDFVCNPFTAEHGYFNNFGAVILPSTIDVKPDALNLKSRGRWITSYVELPEGYDTADIDVSTVMLNGAIPAQLHSTKIGDYDADGVFDLMVKFNRLDLIATLESGEVVLSIIGEVNGISFEGTDTIRVIGE